MRDDDATVVMRRPPPPPPPGRRGPWLWGGAAVAVAVVLLAAVWGLWLRPVAPPPPSHIAPPTVRPAPPQVVAPPATAPPVTAPKVVAPPPAPFPIVTAAEAAIRDHLATTLTVFRFAPDPRIVVLDFPTLHQQGQMLNRVAALVEKGGLPRDRVLNDAELAAAIMASGDTPDTYYFGHDYSAGALVRFFALADAEHVALNPEEERLRALLGELGWFAPGVQAGLITIPRAPQEEVAALDAAARATILHHELSHGMFFSDPAYAAYVRQFWLTALTEGERTAVRKFLGSEGYDTADEELMYNEAQAYLLFTPDPRFCQAANLGMTAARRQELAVAFLRGMPAGWLHDALAADLPTLR